jgi:tRNA(fMet)-specific endonuclease VapC
VLRAVPSRTLVRRLTTVPPADRWTSVISVSQLHVAARRSKRTRLMQDVVRLVAAVKVAPFDTAAAQAFAKLRATVAPDGAPDDAMIAAIALTQDFTLVTRRPGDFARFPQLRAESWIAQ